MRTLIHNPVAEPLDVAIGVNGVTQRVRVAGNETRRVESAVRGGDTPLAITFKGDRRLVILETEFR